MGVEGCVYVCKIISLYIQRKYPSTPIPSNKTKRFDGNESGSDDEEGDGSVSDHESVPEKGVPVPKGFSSSDDEGDSESSGDDGEGEDAGEDKGKGKGKGKGSSGSSNTFIFIVVAFLCSVMGVFFVCRH